jgi:hypothetical protein
MDDTPPAGRSVYMCRDRKRAASGLGFTRLGGRYRLTIRAGAAPHHASSPGWVTGRFTFKMLQDGAPTEDCSD